jgi:hypothetical protein
MAIQQYALRYGQRRLLNRFGRSLPWLGATVALLTLGSTIRRKGLLRGTIDSALDATPFVGAVKNIAETVRGRDFIPARQMKAR